MVESCSQKSRKVVEIGVRSVSLKSFMEKELLIMLQIEFCVDLLVTIMRCLRDMTTSDQI